jgi:hypothetical protein
MQGTLFRRILDIWLDNGSLIIILRARLVSVVLTQQRPLFDELHAIAHAHFEGSDCCVCLEMSEQICMSKKNGQEICIIQMAVGPNENQISRHRYLHAQCIRNDPAAVTTLCA